MLSTVRRALTRLRDAVLPARWPVDPHTPGEVRDVVVTHGEQIRNLVYGVVFIIIVIPALTWLVLTLGQRAREDNCDTVEAALKGYNSGLVDRFVAISAPRESLPPEDLVEYDRKIAVLRDGGDHDIAVLMEGCSG